VAGRVVASGDPGPTILLVAAQRDCDVIVMATNGRSGWRRLVLGSVADHVIRNAEEIPVTLVRRAR
jgi:nucleotide-binding universal stress UspA family protein